MTSTTEYQFSDKIDPMPSLDRPTEAPTSRMYADAYNRDSLRSSSLRAEETSFNLGHLARDFGLVEYNRAGGTDFDYRRQGGRQYDYRNYVSNVYGCTNCGCNGGCSCWDRSRNYFNQGSDPNQMICGLDANGKYYGPDSWRQRLFGPQSQQYAQHRSRDVDPNTMVCGLDANGRYHGSQEWNRRLFGDNPQMRSVCGPGGCYPMDQSRNYYNGRQANYNNGPDGYGQFYGDRNRYSGRGTNYNFRGDGNEPGGEAGSCSGGNCGGGGRGMARGLIQRFLGFLRR